MWTYLYYYNTHGLSETYADIVGNLNCLFVKTNNKEGNIGNIFHHLIFGIVIANRKKMKLALSVLTFSMFL